MTFVIDIGVGREWELYMITFNYKQYGKLNYKAKINGYKIDKIQYYIERKIANFLCSNNLKSALSVRGMYYEMNCQTSRFWFHER